jgi:hypothetical protein
LRRVEGRLQWGLPGLGGEDQMGVRKLRRLIRPSRGTFVWVLVGAAGAAAIGISIPRIADSSLFGGHRSSADAATMNGFNVPAQIGVSNLCRQGLSYTQCHPTAVFFKPDDTTIAQCTSFGCYEQAFGNLAYRRGPKVALDTLARMMRTTAAVGADCHRMAHVIGSASLTRFHEDVSRAFVAGNATCASGYYHGILERALRDAPKLGIVAAARKLCSGAAVRRTVWIAYQCVHGLGHGLMLYSGYDLPYALKVCDQLQSALYRSWCPGGVFMENIVTSYGGQSRWLKKSNPIFPCNVVAERHKSACYGMVTSWINMLDGYDWRKTAQTCRRAEPKWIPMCFGSMGRDASGQTVENPVGVYRICRVDRLYWWACVQGAARDFVYVFENGQRASRLCRLVTVPAVQGNCFFSIGTMLGSLSPSATWRRRTCSALTTRYAYNCVLGTDTVAPLSSRRA